MASDPKDKFDEFVSYCGTILKGESAELIKLIKKRYDSCCSSFRYSQDMVILLDSTTSSLRTEPKRQFVHLKDFLAELKARAVRRTDEKDNKKRKAEEQLASVVKRVRAEDSASDTSDTEGRKIQQAVGKSRDGLTVPESLCSKVAASATRILLHSPMKKAPTPSPQKASLFYDVASLLAPVISVPPESTSSQKSLTSGNSSTDYISGMTEGGTTEAEVEIVNNCPFFKISDKLNTGTGMCNSEDSPAKAGILSESVALDEVQKKRDSCVENACRSVLSTTEHSLANSSGKVVTEKLRKTECPHFESCDDTGEVFMSVVSEHVPRDKLKIVPKRLSLPYQFFIANSAFAVDRFGATGDGRRNVNSGLKVAATDRCEGFPKPSTSRSFKDIMYNNKNKSASILNHDNCIKLENDDGHGSHINLENDGDDDKNSKICRSSLNGDRSDGRAFSSSSTEKISRTGKLTTSMSEVWKEKLVSADGMATGHMAEGDQAGPSTSSGFSVDKGKTVEQTKLQKHTKRLERLLEKLRDKIESAKEKEITLDELDEEDSNYIFEDRLQKKFVKVWNRLCNLQGRTTSSGRPIERKFKYQGTRYPEINRRIERFVNRRKDENFPDFHDIKNIVKKVSTKHNLGLNAQYINDIAREAFLDVGENLQKRRHEDFITTFNNRQTFLANAEEDPAKFDDELNRKLEENRRIGKSRLDEVHRKYSDLQLMIEKQEDEDNSSNGPGSSQSGTGTLVEGSNPETKVRENSHAEEEEKKQEGRNADEEEDFLGMIELDVAEEGDNIIEDPTEDDHYSATASTSGSFSKNTKVPSSSRLQLPQLKLGSGDNNADDCVTANSGLPSSVNNVSKAKEMNGKTKCYRLDRSNKGTNKPSVNLISSKVDGKSLSDSSSRSEDTQMEVGHDTKHANHNREVNGDQDNDEEILQGRTAPTSLHTKTGNPKLEDDSGLHAHEQQESEPKYNADFEGRTHMKKSVYIRGGACLVSSPKLGMHSAERTSVYQSSRESMLRFKSSSQSSSSSFLGQDRLRLKTSDRGSSAGAGASGLSQALSRPGLSQPKKRRTSHSPVKYTTSLKLPNFLLRGKEAREEFLFHPGTMLSKESILSAEEGITLVDSSEEEDSDFHIKMERNDTEHMSEGENSIIVLSD